MSLYAIFHIPREEHAALIAKIARALKPRGVFLATFGATAMECDVDENWTGARMAWSSYAPETYESILADAGFTILESKFEGAPGDQEHHWWVLVRKVSLQLAEL